MSNHITLTPDVVQVLDRAEIVGTSLVLRGQLDRDLYLRTNKTLEALGGKWNKKAKAHLFDADPSIAIENALLTGSVFDSNSEYDFFPTPDDVADRVIAHADIGDDTRVLEPSAGDGALIRALRRIGHNWMVDFCELDAKRSATVLGSDPNTHLAAHDFLTYQPGETYHRIIANPPFSRRRDLLHVAHMYELLKPGGRIVSVMASGVSFRDDRKTEDFKALFSHYDILALPQASFKSSGTGVNTVLFIGEKF